MRILMFGPESKAKGGIATVISNFKDHFKSENNEIFYLESWKEGSLIRRTLSSVIGLVMLPILISSKKLDLVHIHIAQDGSYFRKAIAVRLTKLCRKKVLLHIHGSHFDAYHRESKPLLQRHLIETLQKSDKVIVLNDEVQQYFSAYGIKTEIMFNAVPIPERQEGSKKEMQISCFGQLGKRKGTYDILDVAAVLQEKHPDIPIYLYGDGDIKKIEELIKTRNLLNVHLGGWVTAEQKEVAMQQTMIHILPSYQEGLPMAILETMAQGIPNISTYVGGIPDIIDNGKNGLLIEPGNTKQLEAALLTLITDNKLRQRMGTEAYWKVEDKFSMPAYLKKWEKIYTEWDE
ncbi:glycosytransferase [Listeria grandensis FSL F6-0971]|uniref:Glycosytransferase n=1 Tax=Listeria grandensis FSL F6-0971 TaxID=1265819 RepID=W7AZS7_9LIST|nr:glycosyltransferase family 4 protein [Listeria grandensis]EUJ18730.1 glycosytransferase [Listeria grandensis FSL F6-0971]